MVNDLFDRFAKQLMSAALEPAGRVETQSETRANTQFVDLFFEPDPKKLQALKPFSWLRRMAGAGPALMEFYHQPPDE